MSRACCHHYPGGISGCVSRSLHRRRRPSPFVWRVGSHIDAFEACSMFTHVAARTVRCPPKGVFSRSASGHSSPPDPPRVLPAGARVCRPGFPPGRTVHLGKAHILTVVERAMRPVCLSRKNSLFAGSDEGGEHWACLASLIETCLCRVRHRAVYAARRTMPNGSGMTHGCRGAVGFPRGRWLRSIRHSLAAQSASRKASNRSLGRKRVRLPPWYGLSLANAASLSARCACR